MAALVAGVRYGLSSHSNFHENKSLIFVKLTDSAQRAIEEYLKNRNNTSQNPTIQFLGNQGQLRFPSTQSGHGTTGFTFSLTGNQDIEGPQGSFECIQQNGSKSLENLGALPCKMRIQANEDVYETTRHRMVVAEENNKNKCTRVIKANGPDIGRKVRRTAQTIPPTLNLRQQESMSVPTCSSQSKLLLNRPAVNNKPRPVRKQADKKYNDFMQRPIKERLIQVLAVRPYKKLELYDRLYKDTTKKGIKDREHASLILTLKQVAFFRDNMYQLQRSIWEDVKEDWPFYTEQERAMLKRRKPQNLTPPGSSDTSIGSGQSPNSINAGSPQPVSGPSFPPEHERQTTGSCYNMDGIPTKKQRISHFNKSDANSTTTCSSSSAFSSSSFNINDNGRTSRSGSNNNISVTSGTGYNNNSSGSASNNGGSVIESWDQRQQQQRDHRYRPKRTATLSDSEENHHSSYRDNDVVMASGNIGNKFNMAAGSHNLHNSLAHNNSVNGNRQYHHGGRSIPVSGDNNASSGGGSGAGAGVVGAVEICGMRSMPDCAISDGGGITSDYGSGNGNSPNNVNQHGRDKSDYRGVQEDRDRECRKENRMNGTNCFNDIYTTNAPICNGNTNNMAVSPTCNLHSHNSPKASVPDYLTYYTTISSAEQRKRYKTEYSADYEEYRRLHARLDEVTKRFSQLEKQMNQQMEKKNWPKYEEVRRRIVFEYTQIRSDQAHQQVKSKFQYLHDKLSHIRQLVSEYDAQNYASNKPAVSDTIAIARNRTMAASGDSSTGIKNSKDTPHY